MSIETSRTSPDVLPATGAPEWPEELPEELNSGSIIIDGISYIPTSVLLTGIPKISFKDDRAFAVVNDHGEAPRMYSNGSELGFYCNDTRHLAVWELTFNGEAAIALSSELKFNGNTVLFSMTNRDMPALGGVGRIRRDTFLIRRILSLQGDVCYETVEIRNFDNRPHSLQVEQWVGGRFDDVFEVRGFPRARRGRMLPAVDRENPAMTVLQYEGLDQTIRRTYVRRLFDAEKIRASPTLCGHSHRLEVPARSSVLLQTVVAFDREPETTFYGRPFAGLPIAEQLEQIGKAARETRLPTARFHSNDAILDRAVVNAGVDISMLLTREAGGVLYPYAGIPWFSAPFGRDGLITAYQMLPWAPELARGVLEYAFLHIGTKVDDFSDEQPGKIFHEMRHGEMARTREVPFVPYYGSADATPLSLILLAEYVSWTGDFTSLKRWWPQALRALAWIKAGSDVDESGFLGYARRSPTGLVNQGWKDSHDSVMHADGTLARAPIRLCEVQAYSYSAQLAMATLAGLLGKTDLAAQWRLEALQLRMRFQEHFWESSEGYVYLALVGPESQPCAVKTSNMGHCLWAQMLGPGEARSVADHLLSERMFSGYGIRTLSAAEVAYNPLSYHNGSIWPHDNSITMEGLRYYRLTSHLERACQGLIDVLHASDDFRLPELFCGFRKRQDSAPVPYEVACKPQAWAAGSLFLMLKSMLGLTMGANQGHLVLNSPVLTPGVRELEITGLRCRDTEFDFVVRRTGSGTRVEVTRRSGPLRLLTVN